MQTEVLEAPMGSCDIMGCEHAHASEWHMHAKDVA